MRLLRSFVATAAVAVVAAGCDLDVQNPNNPDRRQVLGNPSDVEQLAASQFQQILSATMGSIAGVQTGMMTSSFMNASGLANNGMGPRSGIPRQPIDNSIGNAYQSENYRDYRLLSFVARNAVDVIVASNAQGFTLGAGREGDYNRMKAFTYFNFGMALGYLSLVYDSAGVPRPDDPTGFIPPLEDYTTINAYALAQFDSAQAYASRAGTTALPSGWLTGPSGAEVTMPQFIRVIRSYKAQIRAGVARNPTERTGVDWGAVIADATNGIQSDLLVRMNPSLGWDYSWLATTLHFRDANWHQMTPYIIGMADVSGAFDAWLAQHRDQRQPFLIVTPDQRFPQGATRTEQGRASAADDSPLPAGQYFRNRNPGKDQAADGWANSWYDHYRHRAWADASRIGDFPMLTRAEIDLLAAEGYIRTGNIPAAAALIDRTRTAAGLPALTGAVTTAGQPVPGGAQCVPRVPSATGPTSCGNILEAMKWEKRMETAYTSYGAWFFDARGWGDLVIGTPLQWPVPADEANARAFVPYNLGGEGRPGGAEVNTYGYGVGTR
jgi:hypothetical protein